ncbi:MAG: hypothetical protein WC783_00990 [Candidatus Paceibacterota bacterium]|jgi:hypothetical protein
MEYDLIDKIIYASKVIAVSPWYTKKNILNEVDQGKAVLLFNRTYKKIVKLIKDSLVNNKELEVKKEFIHSWDLAEPISFRVVYSYNSSIYAMLTVSNEGTISFHRNGGSIYLPTKWKVDVENAKFATAEEMAESFINALREAETYNYDNDNFVKTWQGLKETKPVLHINENVIKDISSKLKLVLSRLHTGGGNIEFEVEGKRISGDYRSNLPRDSYEIDEYEYGEMVGREVERAKNVITSYDLIEGGAIKKIAIYPQEKGWMTISIQLI